MKPKERLPTIKTTLSLTSFLALFSEIIAALFAAASLLLPVNEYRATGIAKAWDCDGPLTSAILLSPAILFLILGIILFVRRFKHHRINKLFMTAFIIFALVAFIATATKAPEIFHEFMRNMEPGSPCGK